MEKMDKTLKEQFKIAEEIEAMPLPKGASTSTKTALSVPVKILAPQVKYPAHYLNARFATEETAKNFQSDLFNPSFSGDDRQKRDIDRALTSINTKGFTGIDLNLRQKQVMQGLFTIGQKQNISNTRPFVLIDNISELYESVLEKKVKKKKAGKYSFHDFSGKETKEIHVALDELTKKPQQVIMKWTDGEKNGKKTYSIYTTEQPLITVEYLKTDIPESELSTVTEDRIKKTGRIKITFLPALLLDYHKYFKLLPSDLPKQIRELCNIKRIREPYLDFIEWLHRQENIEIRMTRETIAHAIKLTKWIKAGRKTMVNETILTCYQIAKKLGYLKDYQLAQKGKFEMVDVFTLNAYKFDHLRPKKLTGGAGNDGILSKAEA